MTLLDLATSERRLGEHSAYEVLDRLVTEEAMRATGGVQVRAAQVLGVSRHCVQYHVYKHGLTLRRSFWRRTA